jgi:hypothetical protein
MLANTITVTIATVDKILLRIYSDKEGSLYRLRDDTEEITLKIRHSTLTGGGVIRNRHNVLMEHTVRATDTTPEYFWSTSVTLTERDGSDPEYLGDSIVGLAAAFSTLWDTVSIGDQ